MTVTNRITVRRTYKYRIRLRGSQVSVLENQFSMCRHLYNWSLHERDRAWQEEGRSVTYREQQDSLPGLKKHRPWFKGVHSQVLQDVLARLDKAFEAFFRRVANGETPGYPKYKKRGQWTSITYPQYRDRPAKRIRIPKIGTVKLVLHRRLPEEARVKGLTVKREAGDKWFACFSVEESLLVPEPEQLPQTAGQDADRVRRDLEARGIKPIGIDVGLTDFYHASDGHRVKPPKHFRHLQDRLAKLQRRFAKAPRRTRRWYKLLRALQKIHYRIRCQRRDFLLKTANDLLARADIIVCEDLDIQDMTKRPRARQDEDGNHLPNGASRKSGLNKSIADASWGQFLSILQHKASLPGKRVIKVPPQYTSQTCPECGTVERKSLSTRTHVCDCGYTANRDYAASRIILRIGLDTLPAHTV